MQFPASRGVKKTVPALVAAGAVALGAIVTIPAQASDIASFQTVYATDVAVASLGGMRSLGTGNIEVTGVTGTRASINVTRKP